MKFARFLSCIAFVAAASASLAQSPGGVSTNLRWWLKANTGVYVDNKVTLATNGQTVQLWADQSGIVNDAVQSTSGNRPTYSTNIINGNPAIFFDNTSDHFLDGSTTPGIGATESFTFILVFKQLSYLTSGAFNDGTGSFVIDRPTATNNLLSFKIVNTNKYLYQRRDDAGNNLTGPVSVQAVDVSNFRIFDYFRNYTNTTEGIHINGKTDISQAGITTAMTGPVIRIGRHATGSNQGFNGYLAEAVLYNKALDPTTEKPRIDSYLAIKYAIPLDQTTLTNYVNSSGTIIYPPATNAAYASYISDIAGVGRDDGTGLSQSSSQSQNAGSVVSMTITSPGTTLQNNELLVWGSNNGDLTMPNNSDVDGTTVKTRLSRVWRAAETGGDVGATSISFDLTNVPGNLTASDLRLMVNTSSTFASGSTLYTGSLAGRVFTVTGINLADGNYFTVGSINATATPLPVELVDFKVRYESPVVIASWKTATEINNDHFTLERSDTDLSFEAVARIPGAGNSKIMLSYQAVDNSPTEGLLYYRLKQTDHDGTFEFSSVKSVFVDPEKKSLSVFPNPNTGQQVAIRVPDLELGLEYVEVLSRSGSVLRKVIPVLMKGNDYSVLVAEPLAPGLYVLRVRYGHRFHYLKMMVI